LARVIELKNATMLFGLTLGALMLIGTARQAMAGGIVPDRSTLNSILGSSAMNDGFEGYNFGGKTDVAVTLWDNHDNNINGLNSTTVVDSALTATPEGPGLVIPGFYISTTGSIQWNSDGYFGLSTQTISGSSPLTIGLTSLAMAFGVDLETYQGYPNTFDVTVYATDKMTVLYTTSLTVSSPSPVFFGYQDSAGIGSVLFSNATQRFAPVLDNLEFGNSFASVPEPSSMVLATIAGLVGLGYHSLKERIRVA
jgi:hypothetical protein